MNNILETNTKFLTIRMLSRNETPNFITGELVQRLAALASVDLILELSLLTRCRVYILYPLIDFYCV